MLPTRSNIFVHGENLDNRKATKFTFNPFCMQGTSENGLQKG